jgi:hypothetical protein
MSWSPRFTGSNLARVDVRHALDHPKLRLIQGFARAITSGEYQALGGSSQAGSKSPTPGCDLGGNHR